MEHLVSRDPRNILATLKDTDADVICLQELTVNHPRHNMDVPKFIAEGLGYEHFFKESQADNSNGIYSSFGNGIFSRLPMSEQKFIYVQDPRKADDGLADYSKEGRVYVEAVVSEGAQKLTIGTIHMSYTDRFTETSEKKVETNRLLEIIKEKKDKYVITGDFNVTPESYTVQEIQKYLKNAGPNLAEKTWTTKPFSYKGFEATTLDWRLDYCFVTPDVQVTSAQVVQTSHSDHLPILIEL
jgi:endonuclease/exonuclease/phosphatase family metal-dependent hydrolase